MGINEFIDLTFEEFSKKYLMQNPINNEVFESKSYNKLIGSKDWRKEGKVARIKN